MRTLGTPSRADDLIASYSSKGPTLLDHVVKPDLVAPGNRIIAAEAPNNQLCQWHLESHILQGLYDTNPVSLTWSSMSYQALSGTSMAAPMVAGAAALMLEKDPSLTPDVVKARLMKTASKVFPSSSSVVDEAERKAYVSQYDLFTVGAGYLDIDAAVKAQDILPADANAASPVAQFDPATGAVTVVNANRAVWGSSAIWGSSAVWGSSVWVGGSCRVGIFRGLGLVRSLGSSAIWGSSGVWGSTAGIAGQTTHMLVSGE